MLKRLYSKRSGFTLVEIIVAFAVFAIMASMVAQILQLAINARNSNNIYAQELARQERIMTIVQKDKKNYNASDGTGTYELKFADGSSLKMGYQVKAADPNATNQKEGINYFLSPIDYTCASSDGGGVGGGAGGSGGSGGGNGGMTQASRMDTRLTGTAGIEAITIKQVIKDEFDYKADNVIIGHEPDGTPIEDDVLGNDDFYLPEGRVRYFIEVEAESSASMHREEVPYAQFRMMFFSDKLDAAGCDVPYEDGKYTKEVYAAAKIVRVGHIDGILDTSSGSVLKSGLNSDKTSSGDDVSDYNTNPFMVQQMDSNTVRIGTPYEDEFGGEESGNGIRFKKGRVARFYVDFDVSGEEYKDDRDVNLTVESFGHNCTLNEYGEGVYKAFPIYEDTFNSDGTPKYEEPVNKGVHPCIYGAYINKRNYNTSTPPADDTE